MAAIESLNQECERKREELNAYYKALDAEDNKMIIEEAKKYSENEEIQKAFIAGYKEATIQPSTRLIHLITMYSYDYVNDKYINMKNVVSKIRTIFRNKIIDVASL